MTTFALILRFENLRNCLLIFFMLLVLSLLTFLNPIVKKLTI